MRFLSIYKTAETDSPPSMEDVAKMGHLIEDWSGKGVLIATEGCLPSLKGARIRSAGGEITVTDGPFIETKEIVGGFALLQANSKAEAIELAKIFLQVAGDGECELRQLYEPSSDSPEFSAELTESDLRAQWEAR